MTSPSDSRSRGPVLPALFAFTVFTSATLLFPGSSSDAIPVHLLTREALALYLEKLAPDGLLAFHLSNRYLQLTPIVARLRRAWRCASSSGLSARWGLLARAEQNLGKLAENERWKKIELRTDEYSHLLAVFYWSR